MTVRERELATLNFAKVDRGAIEETFFPWNLTVQRFREDGLPAELCDGLYDSNSDGECDQHDILLNKYFSENWGKGVMEYEKYMGFDAVRRIDFILPFRRFTEKIVEKTKYYEIKQDINGRLVIKKTGSELYLPYKPIVSGWDEWEQLKKHADTELEKYLSDILNHEAYAHLKEGHDKGDYSIRLNIEGFFWVPRELLGIEEHLISFYEEPELLQDMAEYICWIYETKLMQVIRLIQPDIIYIMEDLSGKNGPMLSPKFFDEFVGKYYRRLIPLFKEAGVGNVFVDTDGDFKLRIPHFMAAGVDGFLPMDVNAGMDIVAVREQFPTLKFIGGYIVGTDHQVPLSASLENYRYYITRLKEITAQAGADLL